MKAQPERTQTITVEEYNGGWIVSYGADTAGFLFSDPEHMIQNICDQLALDSKVLVEKIRLL